MLSSRAFRPNPARWRYQFSWWIFGNTETPLHALHYDIIRNYRRVIRKCTQHWIFKCKFFVWNDGNSQNQTFTIGRLFQCVCQIIHDKKNLNIQTIFVSHLQWFFFERTYRIFGVWGQLLHVQSVRKKWCAYKYNFIAIPTISVITSNYIMAGHPIVVVKDINLLFYHGNAVILTLW